MCARSEARTFFEEIIFKFPSCAQFAVIISSPRFAAEHSVRVFVPFIHEILYQLLTKDFQFYFSALRQNI